MRTTVLRAITEGGRRQRSFVRVKTRDQRGSISIEESS